MEGEAGKNIWLHQVYYMSASFLGRLISSVSIPQMQRPPKLLDFCMTEWVEMICEHICIRHLCQAPSWSWFMLYPKGTSCRFTVCPKADALFPIVSAASIVAKVTRDREIRDLARVADSNEKTSLPLGSGYPSGIWADTIGYMANPLR